MVQSNTVLLSQSDVKELLTMDDVITICDQTFKGFGEETTINPSKISLNLSEGNAVPPISGFINSMPAYVGNFNTAGIKFIGFGFNERKKLNLPFSTGLILLMDPITGDFLGVLDGGHITDLRTGALTATFLKYLKKTSSIRVGLYGGGLEGILHIHALSRLYEIKEVRIYESNQKDIDTFVEKVPEYIKGEIIKVDSPELAADADVVIAGNQSKLRFVQNEWINPGTVVFLYGATPKGEDNLIINADKIIVDLADQALNIGALKGLNQEGRIKEGDIYATIGDLATEKKNVIHTDHERIVCIPSGPGAVDIAIAQFVVNLANERGHGHRFSFIDDYVNIL